MKAPIDHPMHEEFNRQYEQLLRNGGSTSERIQGFAKMRISANERLMFLSSGMLTLTFSAVFGFVSRESFHLSNVGGTARLLWAWKLLMVSVICCIIANGAEAAAASRYDSELLAAEINARMAYLQSIGQQLGKEFPPRKAATVPRSGSEHSEVVAYWTSFAARLCVIGAFVLLYLFVRQTLFIVHQ